MDKAKDDKTQEDKGNLSGPKFSQCFEPLVMFIK